MFAAAAGHFPEVSSTTRWLEPPGVNASSDRLSEACALGRTVYIYISIYMYSHPDQVGSSCKLSQSQYIIEPNLTEVDVSQVQHVDPNYRWHYFLGDAYIYI